MIETVRLSSQAKSQLIRLKSRTQVKTWAGLCRWALALSLRDESMPLVRDIVTDSNIEIEWKTFAGSHGDLYLAFLKLRTAADGRDPADPAEVAYTLKIHVHRGIGRLTEMNLRGPGDLVSLALGPTQLDLLDEEAPAL